MNLDALLEPLPARNQEACKVGRILADLQDPYKTALINLLDTLYADGGLADEALAARMNAAGLPVGAKTVYKHRRKQCTCPEQVTA